MRKITTYAGILFFPLILITSCHNNNDRSDAYGNFEATTVTVSAQGQGEVRSFLPDEGSKLKEGQQVGLIDTFSLYLKKKQLIAQKAVVHSNSSSILSQIKVQEEQMAVLKKQQNRIKKMFGDSAATQQQLDDINGKVDVLEAQMESVKAQNDAALRQLEVINTQVQQINDQISKCKIINPINGTVLEKYIEPGELAVPGKALYKIADLDEMELKVYVSGAQLPSVKIGEPVTVIFDKNAEENQQLPGTISWIASEFEFTPKIIQTKEERVNMVYAVKVRVKNDGRLKIGMPGEIKFKTN